MLLLPCSKWCHVYYHLHNTANEAFFPPELNTYMVNVLFYKRTRQTIGVTELFWKQKLLWEIYLPTYGNNIFTIELTISTDYQDGKKDQNCRWCHTCIYIRQYWLKWLIYLYKELLQGLNGNQYKLNLSKKMPVVCLSVIESCRPSLHHLTAHLVH